MSVKDELNRLVDRFTESRHDRAHRLRRLRVPSDRAKVIRWALGVGRNVIFPFPPQKRMTSARLDRLADDAVQRLGDAVLQEVRRLADKGLTRPQITSVLHEVCRWAVSIFSE